MARRTITAVAICLIALTACSAPPQTPTSPPGSSPASSAVSSPPPSPESVTGATPSDQQFPDVLEAKLTRSADGYLLAVTISSPYDTPERYADGWRVMTTDKKVLAEHKLGHDHANEQPFTRQQGPFAIPDAVDTVLIEGRDKVHGYGGKTVTVKVPS